MVDEDARAAVQLADHHPFGAVDDKGAPRGHKGQGSEIDLLLLDVADGLGLGLLVHVKDHQADRELEGGLVGHAPGQALLHIILGLAELVADILQRGGAGKVLDGKDALENPLQPQILTLRWRDIRLQKPLIRLFLHVDQVGDVDDFLDLAEILADPGSGLAGLTHGTSQSWRRLIR
jgi:hypothetical protein